MKKLVGSAETISIVGVVRPSEDVEAGILRAGIAYPAGLTLHLMELAADSEIVRAQLADPDVNVLTGKPFGEQAERSELDLGSLFSIDEEALSDLFDFDPDSLGFDLSGLKLPSVDLSGLDLSSLVDPDAFGSAVPSLSEEQISELLSSVKFNLSADALEKLFGAMLSGYLEYSAADPSTDYARLPESAAGYLGSEDARSLIYDGVAAAVAANSEGLITAEEIYSAIEEILSGFPAYVEARGVDENADPAEYLNDYLATDAVSSKVDAVTEGLRARVAALALTEEQAASIAGSVYDGYRAYAEANGLPDPGKLRNSFSAYLETDSAREALSSAVSGMIDTSELEKKAAEMMSDISGAASKEIASALEELMKKAGAQLQKSIAGAMNGMADGLQKQISDAFALDPEALAAAFDVSMTPDELRDLFNSLLSSDVTATADSVLNRLGYADADDPSSIIIYPGSFEGKTAIKNILDSYNERMQQVDEDKVIVYTDVVDTLMSSVTEIVNAISGVLIAFVAISLVVSSVMIGVITYISVLERKKEIGILRAIGASKRNISNVFNAETFIIGALAGILGIVITWLLIIPANYLIHTLTGQYGISAVLPPVAAVLLILLSIALTLIGGIIPSRKAARSDPVAALRSE